MRELHSRLSEGSFGGFTDCFGLMTSSVLCNLGIFCEICFPCFDYVQLVYYLVLSSFCILYHKVDKDV